MPCRSIVVQGKTVICPDWLPEKGWSFCGHGYVIYTSRKKQTLIRRGERMSRVIARVLSGEKWNPEVHVHHADTKMNNCPAELIQLPPELYVKESARCPYTGRFITPEELRRMLA